MIHEKIAGIVVAAFVAGMFVASPELRVYAAATITSADIVDGTIQSIDIKNGEVKTSDIGNNSVTSAKIVDGEIKAADIAANAVGASELQGVSKLIFTECTVNYANTLAGNFASDDCAVPGLQLDDRIIATQRTIDSHMSFEGAFAGLDVSDNVVIRIYAKNTGGGAHDAGPMKYAVIAYS